MSDFSIPGVTESKYNTDKIVQGLVHTKQAHLDRLNATGDEFEKKRSEWQHINFLTNTLEDSSRKLYGAENPFREKNASSSNESLVSVTSNRLAENAEYQVRVLQVANPDNFRSKELPRDYKLEPGKYSFKVGERDQSFNFRGGSLKDFVSQANRRFRDFIQFNLINTRADSQVLTVKAQQTGKDNFLDFEDAAKKMATDTELIIDGAALNQDLLKNQLIQPFNSDGDYQLDELGKQLSLMPGKQLRISLPNKYPIREGSILHYEIQVEDAPPPPISNTPDNPLNPQGSNPAGQEGAGPNGNTGAGAAGDAVSPTGGPAGQGTSSQFEIPAPPPVDLADIHIESLGASSTFSGLDEGLDGSQPPNSRKSPIPKPPGQADSPSSSGSLETQSQLQNAQATSASSQIQEEKEASSSLTLMQDGLRIKSLENPVSSVLRSEEVALKGIDGLSQLEQIVLSNPNPGKVLVIKNLRLENENVRNGYLAANPISQASNAKLSYLGVETERPTNNIDDLLPGVNMEVKRAQPTEDVNITIEPDYESILNDVTQFILDYNNLMTELNIVGSRNEAVIQEKVSFTREERQDAQEKLGLLQGDTNVNNLKFRLTQIISNAYPTSEGNRVLADIGISTNLSRSQGQIDRSKLRGYLEFDTGTLEENLRSNFNLVREIFGRDNDGDFIVDSGMAYEVQTLSNAYTRPNGPIPYQITSLENNIKDNQKQISDYQAYLAKYESDLRRKYGELEGTLNQLEQSRSTLDNLSNSFNNRGR